LITLLILFFILPASGGNELGFPIICADSILNETNPQWAISGKQNWRCGINQTSS